MAAAPTSVAAGMGIRPVNFALTTVYGDTEYSILDAAVDGHLGLICLTTSDRRIRVYNIERLSHINDLRGHTQHITDIAIGPSQPAVVFSSQEDVGVMISDLRMQHPARFLNELQGQANGYSIALTPSGTELAVAVGGDVHIVDTRTFLPVRFLECLHTDDISRLRFATDHILVSGGEDLMVNVVATNARDNDMILSTTQFGECLAKAITVLTPGSAHSPASIIATGSCESAMQMPLPHGIESAVQQLGAQATLPAAGREEVEVPVFANEHRLPRPNEHTYLVDFVALGTPAMPQDPTPVTLVWGEYTQGLYDAAAAAGGDGSTMAVPSASIDAAQKSLVGPLYTQVYDPTQGVFVGQPVALRDAHRGVVRAALNVGDHRIITAAEDGSVAVWDLRNGGRGSGSPAGSASGSSSEGKESGVVNRSTQRLTRARPY